MKHYPNQLSDEQKKLIQENILKGVVSRGSTLMLSWALISTLYGFFSLDLFHTVLPELTLWDNLWKRIVFNTLPILLVAFWFKDHNSRTKLKAYLTPIILPLLLMSASFINAWPLIFSGNFKFYLYFHATNIIALSSGISIMSASPQLVLWQILGFVFIYFGPLLFLFSNNDPLIFNLILSDLTMVSAILYIGLRAIHQLRIRLFIEDLKRKKIASTFLGDTLAQAIYESNDMKFKGYSQHGLIMATDLRGYTSFTHTYSPDLVKFFMSKYHNMVTGVLAKHGGYLHKTLGDGLLISFGVMKKEQDLSDIPGLSSDESLAENVKQRTCFQQALDTFNELIINLEKLTEEFNITEPIVIGCGLSYGSIDVIIRGNEKFRQELDIDGDSIIKAVRLESFSKLLNSVIDKESSFLILEPKEIEIKNPDLEFKVWLTDSPDFQIRDFPKISSVLYAQRKLRNKRKTIMAS